ncbi:Beta-galactosidase [Hypsibius exemplaris]|uniref:Beta-galactosidase n=1 Tax=Hypsibius exemplaris TaxID=2072580 RepID=A0A9X6NBS8_HYPEX|nr:Beta-galactosidase [Hypsibius exemplaris]
MMLLALVGLTLIAVASEAVILPIRHAKFHTAEQSTLPAKRSFEVGKDCFLKDGQPFRYISGSFHYWRQPPEYWEDTFMKMRAAGLNTVQTYLNWNLHEPEPLQYNFDGEVDIRRYFQTAQKCGLLVVLRPGPFIDAEVDMGGLPYWLLRMNSSMQLRTSDPSYLHYVDRWYRKVLPLIHDLTYANGGPIISAQIENEYGWVGSDLVYKEFLRDLTKELLGPDIVLFTTDGPVDSAVVGGRVDGTLTTVDFGAGANVTHNFLDVERKFNSDGPLVNSEFYPGWLDHWGEGWITVDWETVVMTMQQMLQLNASFNTYMFYGGSNFGFVAGSNTQDNDGMVPVTQSYDYDAPISEAGDLTVKYMKIRELFQKYSPGPLGPVPPSRPKTAYGKVHLQYTGSLFDHLETLSAEGPVSSPLPLSFEVLKQAYGFVLYRTQIPFNTRDPSKLAVDTLHDRAVVFLDRKPVGILSRTAVVHSMDIYAEAGQTLELLVQNEGRVCSGPINDMKGILGNVSIDGNNLTDWQAFPINLPGFPDNDPQPFAFKARKVRSDVELKRPAFYRGEFYVEVAQDTFLQFDGWRQGYVFVNGRNLGRYWPVQGPQKTLYVPGVFLFEDGINTLELFEVESAPCRHHGQCFVSFVDQPYLNGTVTFRSGTRNPFAV